MKTGSPPRLPCTGLPAAARAVRSRDGTYKSWGKAGEPGRVGSTETAWAAKGSPCSPCVWDTQGGWSQCLYYSQPPWCREGSSAPSGTPCLWDWGCLVSVPRCRLSSPTVPAASPPHLAQLCPGLGCRATTCQHRLPGKCQAHGWAWRWQLTPRHLQPCHFPAPGEDCVPARAAPSQPRAPLPGLGDDLPARLTARGW